MVEDAPRRWDWSWHGVLGSRALVVLTVHLGWCYDGLIARKQVEDLRLDL
jgi:hypothetical protein